MNILIKGMEKPKSCYNHCLEGFIANEEIGCPLNDYIESHQYKNAIHPDCPLIEIDDEIWEALKPKVETMSFAERGWITDDSNT